MIKVRFLPEAEIELLKEVAFYSKARTGTGIRFQAAVEVAIARVAVHPLGGAPTFKETTSILVKGSIQRRGPVVGTRAVDRCHCAASQAPSVMALARR